MADEFGPDDKTPYKRADLINLAQGAVVERFGEELRKVLANIDDMNCPAEAKRGITIEIKFDPDKSRQAVEFAVTFKTKLAAPKQCEGTLFVAHERNGEAFAVTDSYRQPELLKN